MSLPPTIPFTRLRVNPKICYFPDILAMKPDDYVTQNDTKQEQETLIEAFIDIFGLIYG